MPEVLSEVQIWSEVAVDVQTALAVAKTITAISKAAEAVITSAAHGFAVGDIVVLRVKGFADLDWAVVRVKSVAAPDSWVAEGVETTDFTGAFISGTASKVTFGASAATFTDVNPSGGDGEKVAIRTIHTKKDYNLPGNEAPLSYAFGSLWLPTDAALVALRAGSRKRQTLAIRFRWLDGTTVLFAGMPSVTMAPGGSAGGAVTTPVSVDVRGWLQSYGPTV